MAEVEAAVATPELLAPDLVVLLAVNRPRLREQVAEVVGMRMYANFPVEFLQILRGREGQEAVAVRGTLPRTKLVSTETPRPLIPLDIPAGRERIVVAPTTVVVAEVGAVESMAAKAEGSARQATRIPVATGEAPAKTIPPG